MRLYTTPKGQWAGTRAEAKKLGTYIQYEVPTSKRELLFFLNNYRVKVNSSHNDFATQNVSTLIYAFDDEKPQPEVKTVITHRESAWHNINRVAEEAPLSELTTAMRIIMNRLDEEIESETTKNDVRYP
jgi:hypothetical protein